MTRIFSSSDPGTVSTAVRLLREGELVCYPTDTVYGLGAAATNDDAVRRLFAAKERDLDKPMPLLIAGLADAPGVAEVTPPAPDLIERFWPGGLTIVMRKRPDFQSLALGGQDTVGLRVPDHQLTRMMIRALGEPLVGTSANRAGGPSPLTAQDAASQLGDTVALVIDDGPAPGGVESTVVDITRDPPAVLREGAVSREALEAVLGRLA